MFNLFQKIAYWIRPDIKNLTGINKTAQLINMFTLIFTAPLAMIGLVWLVALTDLNVLLSAWKTLAILFLLILVFNRFPFELQLQLRPGVVARTGGALGFVVTLSSVLIFGASAYWIGVLGNIASLILKTNKAGTNNERWAEISTGVVAQATGLFANLTGIWVYTRLGGNFPLETIDRSTLWPALALILCYILLPYLIMSPIIWFISYSSNITGGENAVSPGTLLFFLVTSSLLPQLAVPFTLLGAVLYSKNSFGFYLFFLLGVLLASILASALTTNVQQRSQRARELGALENLGRAVIAAPPEISPLPAILGNCFTHMFTSGRGRIWLSPEEILYESQQNFPEWEQVKVAVHSGETAHYEFKNIQAPGENTRDGIAVPILKEDGQILGGVYYNKQRNSEKIEDFLPALQSLAAQVASALYRIESYHEALLKARMTNELEIAGRIQANFLPEGIPSLPEYEIAASITPARQTSGDFYDFIPLPDGRLGIIVADVADKGTGAALFMALSRTLIRTYALQFPNEPDRVMELSNQRILQDTQSALFVTTFYGIINPANHTLNYVNGGHNPPYLFRFNGNGNRVESLTRTGIPLGIFEDARWTYSTTQFQPGDLLVLYTDGVTEAENDQGEFFEDPRLLEAVKRIQHPSAQIIHDTIRATVQQFTGTAPQGDDITLMVVQRKEYHPV